VVDGQEENDGNSEVAAPPKKRRVGGICSEYLNAVELDRLVLEESLAADAAIAAEQRYVVLVGNFCESDGPHAELPMERTRITTSGNSRRRTACGWL
jgi:hypothetical protein